MEKEVTGQRRRRLRRLMASGAVVLSATSLVSACGSSASSAGSSDGDLVVGGMLSFTAAGSNSGPALTKGAKARFDQINAAGGIDGHKVKFVTQDDALDPAKAPAAMRTLVESKGVLSTLGGGGADSAAVQPYLAAHQIFSLNGGSSTQLISSKDSTFRLDKPTYEELAARDVEYAVKTLGFKKIAVAYTPDDVGEPIKAGTEEELAKFGLKPVAEVSYSPTATNADAQAAKLKASGAQFVVINSVPSIMSLVFKSAQAIGYKPWYGATFAGATPSLPQIMGDSLANRILFATSFVLPDSKEAADFRKWVKAAGGDINDTNTMIGWVGADATVAVLTQAVKAAGGKVPTAAQVVEASENVTVNDNYLKLTWSKDDWTGPDSSSIIKLTTGGKYVLLDPDKPNPIKTTVARH